MTSRDPSSVNNSSRAVVKSLVDAKGDIIVATGADSVGKLTVGASNGMRLVVDSAETTGIRWAADTYNVLVDSKGDLLAGSAADTLARLAVGTDGQVLIASSGAGTGLAWSSTLGSITLSSPSTTNALLSYAKEQWFVSATAAGSTVNFNVLSGSAWLYTSNATSNWTLNIRGDSSVSLNSILAVGESITVAFAATNGATPYRHSALTIDGTSVTPRWQGALAPSAGNANSTDVYTFTIVKTAATPTYTVFGAQVRFA